jgi:hypothetical protein
MTKQELEQQHPELAAELRAEGAASERARYDSHVALGRQSGALKMALADYEAGKPVTETMAAHMGHAFRQRAIQDRADDDLEAAAATSSLGPRNDGDTDGQTALAASLKRLERGNHVVMP